MTGCIPKFKKDILPKAVDRNRMRTNILYVIWSLGLGGAEQVVIQLAKGLDNDRFQPFVCCLNDAGPFADELKGAGVKIFALQKKRGIDISIVGKIIRIIRENDINLVHTHLWGASLWGRIAAVLAGVPVVVTEHNVDVWKKWHYKFIDRILAAWTRRLCAVSRKVKDFYVQEVGIAPEKIEVIYNGVDPLPPAAPAAEIQRLKIELGIEEGALVLVNIGRLVPAKANHIFIEAVRILLGRGLNVYALIIGDGPLREELTRKNHDLIAKGLLKFTGMRRDVASILDFTDIAVLSSTREGFSIVILECMAKGVPFVATDVGGNGELIIDGRTGFLSPCGDSRALADRVEKILKDPDLARRMGEEAKRTVRENFSLARMIQQTQALYDAVYLHPTVRRAGPDLQKRY